VGGSVEAQRGVMPNSVAVLPFKNLSLNPDDAYFADGIHEEVLSQLRKLRNLT
jgi:TolB-like protein